MSLRCETDPVFFGMWRVVDDKGRVWGRVHSLLHAIALKVKWERAYA